MTSRLSRRPRTDLSEHVVLLTGAARGIGAYTAELLVERGARVAMIDVDGVSLTEMASRLGDRTFAHVADVCDLDAMAEAASAVAMHFGRIDIAIANAGVLGPVGTLEQVDPVAFERVLEVNLLGVWHTLRATVPYVREQNGYLLAVASIAAAMPTPAAAAYGSSKAGAEALARALRLELAHTGTDVGIAYFGLIESDLVRAAQADHAGAAFIGIVPRIMRPAPTLAAAEAIVHGIERRSRRVCAPRWVPAFLAARQLLEPVMMVMPTVPRMLAAIEPVEVER